MATINAIVNGTNGGSLEFFAGTSNGITVTFFDAQGNLYPITGADLLIYSDTARTTQVCGAVGVTSSFVGTATFTLPMIGQGNYYSWERANGNQIAVKATTLIIK